MQWPSPTSGGGRKAAGGCGGVLPKIFTLWRQREGRKVEVCLLPCRRADGVPQRWDRLQALGRIEMTRPLVSYFCSCSHSRFQTTNARQGSAIYYCHVFFVSIYLLTAFSLSSFHPFCHLSVAEFLLASQVNFRSKYRQPAPVSSAHVCAPISCCIELRTMLRADGCPGRRPDALNNLLAVPSLTDWDMAPDSLHSCHRWSINSTTLSHVELLALARLGG